MAFNHPHGSLKKLYDRNRKKKEAREIKCRYTSTYVFFYISTCSQAATPALDPVFRGGKATSRPENMSYTRSALFLRSLLQPPAAPRNAADGH